MYYWIRWATVVAQIYLTSASIMTKIPVPKGRQGFVLEDCNPSAPIQIEVYLELVCKDSAAYWPLIKQLARHYGQEEVCVRVHQLPLPYHQNGFLTTLASTKSKFHTCTKNKLNNDE